jgi:hypothetical protein
MERTRNRKVNDKRCRYRGIETVTMSAIRSSTACATEKSLVRVRTGESGDFGVTFRRWVITHNTEFRRNGKNQITVEFLAIESGVRVVIEEFAPNAENFPEGTQRSLRPA